MTDQASTFKIRPRIQLSASVSTPDQAVEEAGCGSGDGGGLAGGGDGGDGQQRDAAVDEKDHETNAEKGIGHQVLTHWMYMREL
ncbi:hypothetical protein [Catenulispora pinisilvae]|uniref:hypothetical protein n=1 Tax=Catenulispora pinisilvae TaxID=2705253 RepID=UPI0018922462|nr:hypothetical protein [Catenulispora pinisilvae]